MWYVYAFRDGNERTLTKVLKTGQEVGGYLTALRHSGWTTFWRRM